MKKTILFLILISFATLFNAQITKKLDVQNNFEGTMQSSFAQYFFQKETAASPLKEVRKLDGKLYSSCFVLDSILKNEHYKITKCDTISFYGTYDTSLIFYLKTEKQLEGLAEFNKADCFKNNLFVVFNPQKDGTYTMSEFFYKPLNQGVWGLSETNIFVLNKKLYIKQYGGNAFGSWGTEYIFIMKENKWILWKSNLYSAKNEYGDYIDEKLIWSKQSEYPVELENLYYSKDFPPQVLEDLLNEN